MAPLDLICAIADFLVCALRETYLTCILMYLVVLHLCLQTLVPLMLRHLVPKKKDYAGSDNTPSIIKGGGMRFKTQPPTRNIRNLMWIRGIARRSTPVPPLWIEL